MSLPYKQLFVQFLNLPIPQLRVQVKKEDVVEVGGEEWTAAHFTMPISMCLPLSVNAGGYQQGRCGGGGGRQTAAVSVEPC